MEFNKKKQILQIILILLVLPILSAVVIEQDTSIYNEVINLRINCTSTYYADSIVINSSGTTFNQFNRDNSAQYLSFTVNESNKNYFCSDLPYISTSTNTNKVITSNLDNPVTATSSVTLAIPSSVGNIDYTSSSNNYNDIIRSDEYTIAGDTAIFTATLEKGNNNIELDYSCSEMTNTSYSLLMILATIMLIGFLAYKTYIDWENGEISAKNLIYLFIVIIISITMWLAAGQNLGEQCPVK